MSEKDGKTEEPTSKRISDAKKDGQIPKSQDLSSAISFTIFAFLLVLLLSYTFEHAFIFFKNYFSANLTLISIENELDTLGLNGILFFFILAGPALAIAFLSAYIGNLIQVGFMFLAKPLKPSADRLNPVSNLKNIVGKQALFGLIKNILKLVAIIYIIYTSLSETIPPIFNLSTIGTENIFYVVVELLRIIVIKISLFLVILGIADYFYQRYEHKQQLKMTKQEIIDEHKEMEGDPQMKAQRKQFHRDLLNGNIGDVRDADVVVTNPEHIAIAIRYDIKVDEVPIVLVKGAEHMAKLIREEAEKAEVPMIENVPIARSLYKTTDAGDPIPAELYQAVAEILALIYQLEENKKGKI